jgi:hypothetical protein
MLKIIYLTNTFDIDNEIELKLNKLYNFNDTKFCGLNIDTYNNDIIYITPILNLLGDKIKPDCLVLLDDNIIHINIDKKEELSINTINELIKKFNIKQIDNYNFIICKKFINNKKDELIKKLNNNNIKNEISKIKLELSNFLCINNNNFSLIFTVFNLDMMQNFHMKEIILSMELKKEIKEIKIKQNEYNQNEIIDKYFNLLLKLII